MAVFLSLLLFATLLHFAVQNGVSQPYCFFNVTKRIYRPQKLFSPKLRKHELVTELLNICCAGYAPNRAHECMPLCQDVLCAPYERCVAPNVCECKPGYRRLQSQQDCEPFCVEDCMANADCVAPNQCACQPGYIPFKSACIALCGEGYMWSKAREGCASRCRAGSTWDAVAQICVQKLQALVQLIAKEVPPAADDPDAVEGAGDGAPQDFPHTAQLVTATNTLTMSNNSESGSYAQLQLHAAENATEPNAAGGGDIVTFLNAWHVFAVVVAVLSLLLAISYVAHCIRRRKRSLRLLNTEPKHAFSGGYQLERSQIMVY